MSKEASATQEISSIFQKCPKGHPTIEREDFIYDTMGRRSCRQCALDERKGRAFPKSRVF